ncbi:MAG: efflux RND transporter permease subunit, partial [Pseudomonadota bacterium]
AHSLAERPKRLWSPWRQFLLSLLFAAVALAALDADTDTVVNLVRTSLEGPFVFADMGAVYAGWAETPSWVSYISADAQGAFLVIGFFDGLKALLTPVFAAIELLFSWAATVAMIVFSNILFGLSAVIGVVIPTVQWIATLVPETFVPVALGLTAFALGLIVEFVFYLMALNAARRPAGRSNFFRRGFDNGFRLFKDYPFTSVLKLTFHWRYITMAICVGAMLVCAVGVIRGGKIGFSFFPSPEAESVTGHAIFHPGIPKKEALAIIAQLEAAAHAVGKELGGEEELIESVLVTYGQSGVNRGQNFAEIKVDLTESEVRSVRTPVIVNAWRKAVPKVAGLKRFSISQSRGGAPGRDIDIQLQGGTPDRLKKAAGEVVALISAIDGLSGVADSLPFGKPEIILELNERGRTLGLSIDDVGRQVRAAFEGSIARLIPEGDDEITVRVRQVMRFEGLSGLRNFQLRTPTGNFVPLGEVVSITEAQGFAAIQREDGKLTVSVTADVNDNITTTQEVIDELEANGSVQAITSRYGITYRYDGKDKERADAFADLRVGIMISLAMIYIILAWMFGSYTMPLAVMMIIPFGVVGAVVGHYLLGFKLTMLSLVGMLGLSGILVNDSLILASRFQERRKEGDSVSDAAIGASRDRLRAVLLTSLSTIGGLTPLMFETSRQAQFLLPMVITIVFGLAFATLLVLFMVPALIGIGNDIGRFFRLVFGSRESLRQEFFGEKDALDPPSQPSFATPAKTQVIAAPER